MNLIQATLDHAQERIDSIDQSVLELDKKKEQLLMEKEAYVQMLIVAKDFISQKKTKK